MRKIDYIKKYLSLFRKTLSRGDRQMFDRNIYNKRLHKILLKNKQKQLWKK